MVIIENDHPSIGIKARFRFHFHQKKIFKNKNKRSRGNNKINLGPFWALQAFISGAFLAPFRRYTRRRSGTISGVIQVPFKVHFRRHLTSVKMVFSGTICSTVQASLQAPLRRSIWMQFRRHSGAVFKHSKCHFRLCLGAILGALQALAIGVPSDVVLADVPCDAINH